MDNSSMAARSTNEVEQGPIAAGQSEPTQLTQNALPGVTFSGFQPAGLRGIIGVREERREDIWLIQRIATPRTGNPAGR